MYDKPDILMGGMAFVRSEDWRLIFLSPEP